MHCVSYSRLLQSALCLRIHSYEVYEGHEEVQSPHAVTSADVDSYNPVDHVDIQVQVDGAPFNNHFTVPSDASVIAADTPGNQYGVDFWLNDGKGNPVTTNPFTHTPWPPLVTIFGPGRLPHKFANDAC